MPSLRRLSPSTSVDSAGGTRSRLKVATTAAGSVAETIAPTMNARSSRRPVPTFRTSATIRRRDQDAGDGQQGEAAEPAPELGEAEAIGRLEDEAGQEHEQDEVGRHVERRVAGRLGDDADDEPRDDQGDRVRQPEGSGDDRDERGQAEQADQQLDRVRDRRFVHQTVTGNGPSVTRRRAFAGC